MILFQILKMVLQRAIGQPAPLLPIDEYPYLIKFAAKTNIGVKNPAGAGIVLQCRTPVKDDVKTFKAFCNILIDEIKSQGIDTSIVEWTDVKDSQKTTREFSIPLSILQELATKNLDGDNKIIIDQLIQALAPTPVQLTARDLPAAAFPAPAAATPLLSPPPPPPVQKDEGSIQFIVNKTRSLLEKMDQVGDNQASYKFSLADKSIVNTCFVNSTLTLTKQSTGEVEIEFNFSIPAHFYAAKALFMTYFKVDSDGKTILDSRIKTDDRGCKIKLPLPLLLTLLSTNDDVSECTAIQSKWQRSYEQKVQQEEERRVQGAAEANRPPADAAVLGSAISAAATPPPSSVPSAADLLAQYSSLKQRMQAESEKRQEMLRQLNANQPKVSTTAQPSSATPPAPISPSEPPASAPSAVPTDPQSLVQAQPISPQEFIIKKVRELLEVIDREERGRGSAMEEAYTISLKDCQAFQLLSLVESKVTVKKNGQGQVNVEFITKYTKGFDYIEGLFLLGVAPIVEGFDFIKGQFLIGDPPVLPGCISCRAERKVYTPLNVLLSIVPANADTAVCLDIERKWQEENARRQEAIAQKRAEKAAEIDRKNALEQKERAERLKKQREEEAIKAQKAAIDAENLRRAQEHQPTLSAHLKDSGALRSDNDLPLLLSRNIELLRHENTVYHNAFIYMYNDELTPYFENVFTAFAEEFNCLATEFNAQCHDLEKMKEFQKKLDIHIHHFNEFTILLRMMFEIVVVNDEYSKLEIVKVSQKPAHEIATQNLRNEANGLIKEIGVTGLHRLALTIADLVVKALTAIGIPATTTSAGAYAGAVVGGIFGAPTVVISGPIGPAITASVGALIGGGLGFFTGASATYATAAPSKVGFFNPLNTALQTFSEKVVERADDIDSVASAKRIASPAA